MMMSANRPLLRRLLVAAHPLRRLRTREISVGAVAWNWSSRHAGSMARPRAAFGSNALFSTTTATKMDDDLRGERDGASTAESNDGPSEDLDEKDDGDASPVELSASAIGSSEDMTIEPRPEDQVSVTKSAKISTERLDEEHDVIAPKQASKKDPANSHHGNSEEIIRTGQIKWLNIENKCGVLIQDNQYRKIGPNKTQHVSFRFNDIYPEISQILHPADIKNTINPVIDKRRRFQFQAKHREGSRDLMGFNIRYEGGHDIAMLHYPQALEVIRKAKAILGMEIYHTLSSASPGENDGQMLKAKVDRAFRKCEERIQWARRQITDPKKVARDRKAKLGGEVYDLLENIAAIDDIERRIDDAYIRCLKDLSALELNFSMEGGAFGGEQGGFDEFSERDGRL